MSSVTGGARVPKMMKWGLIPHWAKNSKLQSSTINARSEDVRTKHCVPRRLEMGPALPRGHGLLLRMEEARSERKGKTALRDRHGRQRANGHGRHVGEMEIARRRTSIELHYPDLQPNGAIGELHYRMPVIWTKPTGRNG